MHWLIGLVAVALIIPTAALAQWYPARPELARMGVVASYCQGDFCVSIACFGSRAGIFSMAPGGGPFEGPARGTVDGLSFGLNFAEDGRFASQFGMVGSFSGMSAEAFAALRDGGTLVIAGRNSGRQVFRAPLAGFRSILARRGGNCP